jgi:hypothetical protein
MPGDDLDLKFEKALAGHLRGARGDAAARDELCDASACPDAETLAAYQDGALQENQLLLMKEHIAGCSRCQEILLLSATPIGDAATVVATARRENEIRIERSDVPAREGANVGEQLTAPVVAPASLPIGRRSPATPRVTQWRWLAPAGSIAALLLLWLATHNRNSTPTFDLAKNQQHAALPQPTTKDVTPELDAPLPSRQEPVAKPRKAVAEALPAAPVPNTVDTLESRDSATNRSSLPIQGRAYSPPASAEASPAPSIAPDTVTVTSSNGPVANGMTSAKISQVEKKQLADWVQVPSPVAAVLWRVSAAGVIQRSTDGGDRWTLQPSGVVEDLISGSAPSDTICWVVGRNATVLRTVDAGRHWGKIQSPVTADISNVFAVNAQQATVAGGGQSYQTTDGGQTWSAMANQTNP